MFVEINNDIEKMLDPQLRLQSKLETELRQLGNQSVSLVIIDGANYLGCSAVTFKALQKRSGLVISVNKPANDLQDFLNKNNVAFENWFFLDCVSETDESQAPLKTVKLVGSPKNLLEISVETERVLKLLKDQKPFVIIDSLSTLLLYNKADVIERFVHNLTGKLHESKAQGIYMMIHTHEDTDVIEIVSQFCDKVIQISEHEVKKQ